MAGFNADTAVEPLDWDFTKYAGADAKGTTPEPPTKAIDRFFRRHQSLTMAMLRTKNAMVKTLKDKADASSPEEALAELKRWAEMTPDQAFDEIVDELNEVMPEGEMEGFVQQMAELVAETASNCPTADQIMALPHRLRVAYFGWFVTEMNSPEASAAGSSSLLGRLNGVGLGI